ncbi:DUF3313 family protein [Rhizobium lusitanum]|uniref:DUF3313 family protein n=1 Tax=Rhizobium lusitanum TaxID=293958 RepID=UPI001956A1CA|nr:DUF3313 family protein [Rhizobium lusitanum]MBM7049204.1 DUF3313 family protein [Rhizobium lusitanum]
MPQMFIVPNGTQALQCIALAVGLSGCVSAKLETGGTLTAYQGMTPENGVVAKSKQRMERADVMAARTVVIVPTTFSATASGEKLSEQQRRVIANAVDRSVCIGLSDRFQIVAPEQSADLTIHTTITHVTVTNAKIAAASKVASAVPTFLSFGAPVPVPRIPIGMGTLSIEAEALNREGQQKAALLWARGTDVLTGKARVSAAGDAYDLASMYGNDFSKFLVTGKNPYSAGISLPTTQKLKSSLGGNPKYAACEKFGKAGVANFVAGALGAPPEWVDKGEPRH